MKGRNMVSPRQVDTGRNGQDYGTASKLFEQEPLYDPPEAQTDTYVTYDDDDKLQGITGDTNLDLIQSQIQRMDSDRLNVAAGLINLFNYAVQVQAGRNEWNAQDYAAFVICMRSVDGIGVQAIQQEREKL